MACYKGRCVGSPATRVVEAQRPLCPSRRAALRRRYPSELQGHTEKIHRPWRLESAALVGSTQVACGHRSDSNAFPSARAVGNALRSRAVQRILTAICRAARLEMCSPEDRMPHEDPPHEAQAPPWLRTPGTRYPQPPRSFWARIGPPKTVESKLAHAGFAGATVNLVEVPRDASDWSARKWQSAHQGTCAAPRRGDAKELGEQLRPRAAGAERNHGENF
jgi:hypothetical protein